MFRGLLAYPLVFAMAVGPLLCCCTAGRVVASLTPASPPRSISLTAPAATSHSCCSHKHRQGHKPTQPKPAPAKQGQCPCKDGAQKAQTAPSNAHDQSEHIRSVGPDFLLLSTCPEFPAPSGDRFNGARYGPSRPFPSTSDILFLHHKLRC